MKKTEEKPRFSYMEDTHYRAAGEPISSPQVNVVLPAASKKHICNGAGTKVFICGHEVKRISKIDYGTEISADGIITSVVTIRLHEPIEVTFALEE